MTRVALVDVIFHSFQNTRESRIVAHSVVRRIAAPR